jgi:hypothetical protein
MFSSHVESKMNRQARSKLNEMMEYPFMKAVGLPVSGCITGVPSRQTAAKYCCSQHWKNCRLMARNVLNTAINRAAWERAQMWNPLIDELQPLISGFLADVTFDKVNGLPFADKVRSEISRDMLMICLESEYEDVVKPPFFIPVLDPWYSSGHLPCGWDGDAFPAGWDGIIRDGQLMVY